MGLEIPFPEANVRSIWIFPQDFPVAAHISVDDFFRGGIRLADEFCPMGCSSFAIVPFAARLGVVPVVERLLAASSTLNRISRLGLLNQGLGLAALHPL